MTARTHACRLWPVVLVLLTGLLIWLRLSGLLEKYFEPWGVVALGTLLLVLTGQAAGRTLRSRRNDTLPLWLVVLALGGVGAAFLAQPGESLAILFAIGGWTCGLGLAGFPTGFEV